MAERFKDKVVIVTGASKGIGRACAEAFAREGGKVSPLPLHFFPFGFLWEVISILLCVRRCREIDFHTSQQPLYLGFGRLLPTYDDRQVIS